MSECDACGSTRGVMLPWVIANETCVACMTCRAKYPQGNEVEDATSTTLASTQSLRIDAISEQLANADALTLEQARQIATLEALLGDACDSLRLDNDRSRFRMADKIDTARIAESKKESAT